MLVKCRLQATPPNDTATPAPQWRPLRTRGLLTALLAVSATPLASISPKYILVYFGKTKKQRLVSNGCLHTSTGLRRISCELFGRWNAKKEEDFPLVFVTLSSCSTAGPSHPPNSRNIQLEELRIHSHHILPCQHFHRWRQ